MLLLQTKFKGKRKECDGAEPGSDTNVPHAKLTLRRWNNNGQQRSDSTIGNQLCHDVRVAAQVVQNDGAKRAQERMLLNSCATASTT